jgi:multiple sugar transport system ATP-binding protein
MADVELKDIQKTFADGWVKVLGNIDLKIGDGQFAAVLGPSECGKSTLLRIVAGLEKNV